jgi:hypothetical protein
MAEVTLRVLDTRIGARYDKPRPTDVIVGSASKLSWVIDQIRGKVGQNKLRTLSIAAHGFESLVEDPDALMSYQGGGYGIDLGEDHITLGTVSAFGALDGMFVPGGILEIYACAAADVSRDQYGLSGNGRLLMSELAAYTNAIVRASDAIQMYTAGVRSMLGFSWYEGVDFGDWEGKVWLFSPSGNRSLDRSKTKTG